MKRVVAKLPSGDWCVLNGPIELLVEHDAALECIKIDGTSPFDFQDPQRTISANVDEDGTMHISIDG